MPDLSIIIPCYNAGDTLAEQLEAFARQKPTRFTWEVIISDNGSTDNTLEVVASYAGLVPFTLLYVNASARKGVSYARNAGARGTSARWLAFVDADDVVADNWVSAMADNLNTRPFVAGRLDDQLLNSPRVRAFRAIPQKDGLQTSPQGWTHAGGSNLGIHSDLFFKVDGFNSRINCLEDTDFCFRVQKYAGVDLTFAPDVLVNVRLRSTLKGMMQQGYAYGRAFARINLRYPVLFAKRETIGDRRPLQVQSQSTMMKLLKQLHHPESVLWQLSWHVGYKLEQRNPK